MRSFQYETRMYAHLFDQVAVSGTPAVVPRARHVTFPCARVLEPLLRTHHDLFPRVHPAELLDIANVVASRTNSIGDSLGQILYGKE